MANQSILERAKEIFAKYSRSDVIYFIADGTPFFNEGLANHSASSLKNKEVTTVTRAEAASTDVITLPLKTRDELLAAYLVAFKVAAPDSATDDEISMAVSFNQVIESDEDKSKAQAQALADAQAKADADAKAADEAQALADAQVKADADAKAAEEAKTLEDANAKAITDAQAIADADAQAVADAQAKADEDAKALDDAKAKAAADKQPKV